ncbi:MAG: spore germination protein [Thermaerobacter sp.]|nr:spore germination protein [Thermaerobacter sp.]
MQRIKAVVIKVAEWWDKIRAWLTGGDKLVSETSRIPLQGYEHDVLYLQEQLGHAPDFAAREFRLGVNGSRVAALYLRSLADEKSIANSIIMPLSSIAALVDIATRNTSVDAVRNLLSSASVADLSDLGAAMERILLGETVLLAEGLKVALVVGTRASIGRTTSTPEIETTVFGPKVAFVESLETNLALIRQQVPAPTLRIETFDLGRRNPRRAMMFYLTDLATRETVAEFRQKIKDIDVGSLLETEYLHTLIGKSPWSPFPQAIHTERPDRVSGNLLEGRIALLLDGSPEAMILPTGFSDLFQSPGDYYEHHLVTTLMRALRMVAFLLSTTLPAFYVAITTFNYEVLPTDLLFAVASARAGIPFPPVIETVLMLVLVDILQEGALRIPAKIGQTVGVVGGFVLGQAVILARLVSPLLVIVVSVSVISSFATPDYRVVGLARLLRYTLLAAAGALSGIGIAAVWVGVVIHMASLEILGVPYLRPLAPLRLSSLSDFVFRKPYRSADPRQAKRLREES